jgi:Zn-dependent protease
LHNTLANILLVAPILLFSVIAHEIAHGYAALKQGDNTALMLGRLSWNPIRHIDPFLTILMPLMLGLASNWRFMLGGAKPVPVNPRNYRNYRRGDIIVSLAGVATNFVIALGCTLLIPVLGAIGRAVAPAEGSFGVLQVMMIVGIQINLLLIAFNLLPIPPLDGSHVMKYLLPPAWSLRYQQLGRYGLVILVGILVFGRGLFNAWMAPANAFTSLLIGLVSGSILPTAESWLR